MASQTNKARDSRVDRDRNVDIDNGRTTMSARGPSQRLLNDFVAKWNVGLAIFDEHLRYQAVNPWLAARNGLAAELHVGKHLMEVSSELAAQIGPALKAALISRQPILNFETAGTMSEKRAEKRWIANFCPAKDTQGNVKQIGAIFVEGNIPNLGHATILRSSPNLKLLRSWKEIASYMGTCVKTVQRWERMYGLPVRRVSSGKGAVVFALRSELENWMVASSSKKNR